MNLRKAKGRMFKKITHTCTFIQGCNHDCGYGWCKKIHTVSHEPKLRGDPLKVFRVKDAYIFPNSAHDAYSSIIPDDWISLQHEWIGRQHPSNKFLLQTKNPERFFGFIDELRGIKSRIVLGTTLETNRTMRYAEITGCKAPQPDRRWAALTELRRQGFTIMGSIEPVMAFDPTLFLNILVYMRPKYVEIGPDNYHSGLPEPSYEDVMFLRDMLVEAGVEVVLKDGITKRRLP